MRKIQTAAREAKRVLADSGVRKAPVDVYRIARRYAQLVEMKMEDDISGMLIPLMTPTHSRGWAIVVNAAHAEVRKRFTAAHELGHLLLHGFTTPHADRGFKVRLRSSRSSDGTVAEEIEANQFAAELLMPADILVAKLDDVEIDFALQDPAVDRALAELAKQFKVSRQALEIRLANLLH